MYVQISEAATLQGAKPVNHWIGGGRNASHVVCEGTSAGKYMGHSDNLVTVSSRVKLVCT